MSRGGGGGVGWGASAVPDLTAGLPTEYYDMMLADAHVLNLQTITKQICILQRDLTRKASERFAEDDFESHWMHRTSAEEREDFILEGFVRACVPPARKWCPELTLKRLNCGSGQGFLDLLQNLTFTDLDKVPNYFRTVPNAVHDRIHAFGDANSHPGRALVKKASESPRTTSRESSHGLPKLKALRFTGTTAYDPGIKIKM
ncbi:hypothetical protein B0H13DRAFT_2377857 [Mycena leptocephala]|nr:hypothetical protein B0H13DRAFT_2377857 [Mycena leptocephala]